MALPTQVQGSWTAIPFEGRNEFETRLNRLFGYQGDGVAAYAVDVREDADHLYLEAELPGFKKEQVDITLEDSVLTISAERKTKEAAPSGEWLLNERRQTRFLRSFKLPSTVDGSAVDAKLSDGVLTVTLNKRQETKPRKITVG